MKKSFYFAAIAALMVLVSCNKDQTKVSSASLGQSGDGYLNEITAISSTDMTKGYCADATFFDTAIEELHNGTGGAPSGVVTPRTMRISAYLTPQDGDAGNYFVDYEFARASDDKWHHDPKIYWPIAGSLDFLAYSSKIAFDDADVEWNSDNASSSVVLNVLENRLQDDIVFAQATQASSAGATSVPMQFKHSQAWIEFQIKVKDSGMADKLAVTSVEIEDLYTTGELTISRGSSTASASWNFRHEARGLFTMPDNYNLYGSQASTSPYALTNALDANVRYMDALIPEQDKTAIVVRYRLAGQPNELAYRFQLDNSIAGWLMGEKYVYEIEFTVNEITADPTVTEYTAGSVSDLSGALI